MQEALLAAIFGAIAFNVQNFSAKMDVPVAVSQPELAEYFGRWIYLTATTNLLGSIYFVLYLSTFFSPNDFVLYLLARTFSLIFALGFFVTVGYYALDHFNPERIKNRDHYRKHGYPNVGLARHLEHIFGIFAVIFHAITFLDVLPESYQSEIANDSTIVLGAFFCYYLALTHLNHFLTGYWTYPIVEDIEKKFGGIGVFVFEGLLVCVFFYLSSLGIYLFQNF